MLFLCGAGSSRSPAPFLLKKIIYKVDKAFFLHLVYYICKQKL